MANGNIHKILNSRSIILYSKSISSDKCTEMESYPLYGDNLYLRKYTSNGKVNYKISYLEPERRILFSTDGIKYADKIYVYVTKEDNKTNICVRVNKFGYVLFKFIDNMLNSVYFNTNKIYEIITDSKGNITTIRDAYYNGSITLHIYKYQMKGNILVENCKKITGLKLSDLTEIDDSTLPTEKVNLYKDSELFHQSINNGNIVRTIHDTADNNKMETVVNGANNLVQKIIYYYDENNKLRNDSLGNRYNIEIDDNYVNRLNAPQVIVQTV